MDETPVMPPRCRNDLGRGLRTWRALHRVKQSHAAELLGVSQPQISRWERGEQRPGGAEARALADLLAARLTGAADRRLGQFVRDSAAPVHLVCDLTHRLLAFSGARARSFRRPPEELDGALLWECASAEIVAAEGRLESAGWYDMAAPVMAFRTSGRASRLLEIREGPMAWTRFRLSDGSHARLVETL
ncbi:helix-turn-helix transcriptional regulator [Roseovarius sp.]|uniref:helix-turn-helix domain-containing protein n=1 Tax=Roseovarius sp. TaxID=1486281 RepID=UPI00261CAEFE|nr:helix-turn-helix transcriptional regulator [Roseovarius sp.]MDM8166145.1 helix-turn-helix transcriptional regulator [Roseovarius sp.]